MNIEAFLNQHEKKDLLRFLTCGSVDDGKSTLIGRLLYDSKLIFDDQLSALRADSEKNGTTGLGEIDYALLLDGLKAEREQGITIDVAYRYFATPKRKFIIADTPGHEQYTRNMATGASTAGLAIILIDARYGVVTQTKRHAFIISLLGIRHLVVAVNKMDLVGYDEAVFKRIREEFASFAEQLQIPEVVFIPLSALKGDNVVDRSVHMPWYTGDPLLSVLETVDIATDNNLSDFRFPVQYVIRPNLDFRGFAGSVASGIVRVGDHIRVLPSGKETTVKAIVTADGNLDEAFSPQAVVLELDEEIDISSGDLIVHSHNLPKSSRQSEAMVVWMAEEPMQEGVTYLLRHAGRNVKARINTILYATDVNTLEKRPSTGLALNEIGRVAIDTTHPLHFDPYSKNHTTGSFILIHPITNTTVGAGMIADGVSFNTLETEAATTTEARLKDHVDRREFLWETGLVDSEERARRNHHEGKTVVITGDNAYAAQEFAKKLEQLLFWMNMNSYYLSLASLTSGLDADIKEGLLDRDEQIRRLGELARILTEAGMIFITVLPDVDGYDLNRLKWLNSPHGWLVVDLATRGRRSNSADIHLEAETGTDVNLQIILKLLTEKNIIPEYSI